MTFVWAVSFCDPATGRGGIYRIFADEAEQKAKDLCEVKRKDDPAGPDYYDERMKVHE